MLRPLFAAAMAAAATIAAPAANADTLYRDSAERVVAACYRGRDECASLLRKAYAEQTVCPRNRGMDIVDVADKWMFFANAHMRSGGIPPVSAVDYMGFVLRMSSDDRHPC